MSRVTTLSSGKVSFGNVFNFPYASAWTAIGFWYRTGTSYYWFSKWTFLTCRQFTMYFGAGAGVDVYHNENLVITGTEGSANRWYLSACSCDGAAGPSSTLTLNTIDLTDYSFLDNAKTGTTSSDHADQNANVSIGQADYSSTDFGFAGRSFFPAIVNGEMTQAEILSWAKDPWRGMLSAKAKYGLTFAAPLFGFDSPEPDWSGNGNTGTLTGTTLGENPNVVPFSARALGTVPLIGVAGGATGTATQTLPSVTQAGTGEQPHEGTAAQTLGAFTQSASGAQPHIGTAAQTLGAFTQTASGQAPTEGTGAQILGPVTQAGAGVEHPTGTSTQDLPSVTQAASGTTAAGATGTATQTLPATMQAGVGETPHEGTGTQTAPALQQSGVGVQTIPGTAAQTIAALTQAGVGIQVFTGTATQALPSLTQAGAGLQTVPGTAAQIIAALTQSGVGIELPSGTAAQVLPSLTMGAVGVGGDIWSTVTSDGTLWSDVTPDSTTWS